MQAQSALKVIIDHSFDNVSGVQPNLSEFIRRNYALIKADVAAHPSSGNVFGLNAYQEKGAKQGAYVISDGKAAIPAAVTLAKATGVLTIALSAETMTIAGLKAALAFGSEDYITIVGLNTAGSAEYERFHINQSLAATTEISANNIESVFEVEGNVNMTLAVSGNSITITDAAIQNCCAFIITRKVNGAFTHSKATLGAGTGLSWNADAALPTYPVGENKFLNGGDQSYSPSPSPEPEPEPSTEPTVQSVTWNGTAITVGGTSTVDTSNGTLVVTLDSLPEGSTYSMYQGPNTSNIGTKLADFSSTSLTQTVDITTNQGFYLAKDGEYLATICNVYEQGD